MAQFPITINYSKKKPHQRFAWRNLKRTSKPIGTKKVRVNEGDAVIVPIEPGRTLKQVLGNVTGVTWMDDYTLEKIIVAHIKPDTFIDWLLRRGVFYSPLSYTEADGTVRRPNGAYRIFFPGTIFTSESNRKYIPCLKQTAWNPMNRDEERRLRNALHHPDVIGDTNDLIQLFPCDLPLPEEVAHYVALYGPGTENNFTRLA